MEATTFAVDFLVSVGAGDAPHANGSLLEHLLGTHHLLSTWQCNPHVCLAGLFHSIYGTSIYQKGCVSLERRADVVAVIGMDAERIAYLFCAAQRPQVFIQAIDDLTIVNRWDGCAQKVSSQTLVELIEVECANLLDQGLGKKFLNDLALRTRTGEFVLPLPIGRAVEAQLCSAH